MKKCICSELPKYIEGASMNEYKGKICPFEIQFIPQEWVTIYKCQCCGELWKEFYIQGGHGEVPCLLKLEKG